MFDSDLIVKARRENGVFCLEAIRSNSYIYIKYCVLQISRVIRLSHTDIRKIRLNLSYALSFMELICQDWFKIG